MSIEKNQLYYLKKIKKFYDGYKSKKYFPNFDTPIYLASYSRDTIGINFINKIIKSNQNFISALLNIMRDSFYSMYFASFKTLNTNTNFFYDKIIFTWGFKKDFKIDGSLQDKYLNINSKEVKKTLWFVIYLDTDLPKRIKKNIFLFQPISKKRFNITHIIKNIFCNLKYLLIGKDYFLFNISNYNFLSQKISKVFHKILSDDVKKVLLLYEGQPFQNEVVRLSKERYNVKTLGYVHAPPIAFPANYIKKKFSPDKIFLAGHDQMRIFLKLGWRKKDLILCKSRRFFKNNNNPNRKIFLPLNIKSEEKLLNNIHYISKMYNLNKYDIQLHPATAKFKRNINLKKKILKIINLKGNNTKILTPIFIGATGSIIEFLENDCLKAIHITENEIMEKYSTIIWPSLNVKKIKSNIYIYQIKKKNMLLKLGSKQKNLNFFLNK